MRHKRWETIKELGRGGQATTYLVRDTTALDFDAVLKSLRVAVLTLSHGATQEAERENALKLLRSVETYLDREAQHNLAVLKLLHEPARNDEKALSRLRNEVEVLRRVNHPNIVKILDAAPDEGWFVMPYYSGGNLSQYPERFKGDPVKALLAFRTLVDAAAALHAVPVVHRDIKPENIFVSGETLLLGDFGIVYFEDAAHTRLSDSYENVGSRDWMPPWAMGMRVEDVRPSFDVFCLGKVLWAMVSGRTKLRLWYWSREEFNLLAQFRNDERMPWINRLLEGSVREEEENTWRSGGEFLKQLDDVLVILRRSGQVIARNINLVCRVCGNGIYEPIATEQSPTALHNLGVTLRNLGFNINLLGEQLRVLQCTNCGHLEVFRLGSNPPAWREWKA